MPSLEPCQLANAALLDAVRSLAFITDRHGRRPVDYKNLRSRELGSIYESLLELHPEINVNAGTFALKAVAGNRRKTTGCYYTPENLVQCLLDSALDPVLEEACRQPDPEAAILKLKVCDTACGSGHFLTAAAHRMAKRLAAIRTGEEEPAPEAVRTALRQVIGCCIYGVDVNRMAVELCKVALWMEAMEPGKPLPFLEHHIQWGNSLIGTTPALMAKGIPDAAFNPIKGDEKAICSRYKKQNKEERSQGQLTLVDPSSKPWGWLEDIAIYAPEYQPWQQLEDIAAAMKELDQIPDESIAQVRLKQQKYQALMESSEHRFSRLWADAWCAAFVWKKTQEFAYPITDEVFRRIKQNPYNAPGWMGQEIERLREQYHFFHWHIAFAHVFEVPKHEEAVENSQVGWSGGFDVELGNTPWERIKLQEREWFSAYRPDIVNAPNASSRQRMIEVLKTEDPTLYNTFLDSIRHAEGESHIIRDSGRFPLCGQGDINTYSIFAETNRLLINSKGQFGCIMPSGIATDDTTKFFFRDLMEAKTLVSLYDFENREKLFPAIDSRIKFCLLTINGTARCAEEADFVFFALQTDDLENLERHFTLSSEDIALLNPNTRNCPIFRSSRDANLARKIYSKVPCLTKQVGDDDWRVSFFKKMIDLDIHAKLISFSAKPPSSDWIAVYEAKMIHHFNHRFATYQGVAEQDRESGKAKNSRLEELNNPSFAIEPRCWITKETFSERIKDKPWSYDWFVSMRDVARTTDERTAIFVIRPLVPAVDKLPTLFPVGSGREIACFVAALSSFVFDYNARQKVGGTNLGAYIVEQLPVPPRSWFKEKAFGDEATFEDWIFPRVLELTYTAWDLQAFAQDCGYEGAPFRWTEERRFLLRCELDAAYFHLYNLQREDVAFVMETFAIIKRKDEQKYGYYRTKDTILQIYDALAEASRIDQPYKTVLDPPPADIGLTHVPQMTIAQTFSPTDPSQVQ